MDSDQSNRLYSTGEIVLAMTIVFLTLTIPTLGGFVYYFFYL